MPDQAAGAAGLRGGAAPRDTTCLPEYVEYAYAGSANLLAGGSRV